MNCCEHGDHPAPDGKRFCCRHCAECESTDFDAASFDCACICSHRFDPGQPGFGVPDPERSPTPGRSGK